MVLEAMVFCLGIAAGVAISSWHNNIKDNTDPNIHTVVRLFEYQHYRDDACNLILSELEKNSDKFKLISLKRKGGDMFFGSKLVLKYKSLQGHILNLAPNSTFVDIKEPSNKCTN